MKHQITWETYFDMKHHNCCDISCLTVNIEFQNPYCCEVTFARIPCTAIRHISGYIHLKIIKRIQLRYFNSSWAQNFEQKVVLPFGISYVHRIVRLAKTIKHVILYIFYEPLTTRLSTQIVSNTEMISFIIKFQK